MDLDGYTETSAALPGSLGKTAPYAIHHLDMIVELDRPGRSTAAMELVRTMDLGRPTPIQ
jgi:hypothetical protein